MSTATSSPRFNTSRFLLWSAFALVLVLAPLVFKSGLALTLLSQIGFTIIMCLSYNMLLGQGGMLSLGFAVYTGLGAFCAIHALNLVGAGKLPLPVSLVPLVGGLGGVVVALVLGWVSTKKAGNTFAMITIGLGELIFAMTSMFPELFGGESGISSNRVVGEPVMGISFGPQIQLYYLIAVYCFVCTALMFMFTGTPLGRMLNAVRDNPERVEFVGYNTQLVRYISFVIAGFFAGVGGGLFALNFELVGGAAVSGLTSAAFLLFTYIGGATLFIGPIIGAVLMIVVGGFLSEITKASFLYLGIVFMLVVMFAPGGIAGMVMMNVRVAAFKRFGRLWLPYLALLVTVPVMFLSLAALIEMIYHKQINSEMSATFKFLWMTPDVTLWQHWVGAGVVFVVGYAAFEVARRYFKREWSHAQDEIQAIIRMKEAA
ncbi:MAG: hypothetical protein RLZZ618_1741 [Pseudomonadota bacterium]|jgi:branched-chain amino acid transport system permease protein